MVCIIILYCTGMDMGMRITIPKYTWGIGDNKEESTTPYHEGAIKRRRFLYRTQNFHYRKHQRYVKKKYLDKDQTAENKLKNKVSHLH
jgi:hypothetical protein